FARPIPASGRVRGGRRLRGLERSAWPAVYHRQGAVSDLSLRALADGCIPWLGRGGATLTNLAGHPLAQKTVYFSLIGAAGSFGSAVTTDQLGRAPLGSLTLPNGQYTLTASFATVVTAPD